MLRRKKKKTRRPKRVQKRAIINEDLLVEFRLPGRCELCGFWFLLREPHHVFGRGSGGWHRFDIRIALISVGSTERFSCDCHRLVQSFKISLDDVIAIVAKRERVTPEYIKETVNRLKWGPQADNSDYRD